MTTIRLLQLTCLLAWCVALGNGKVVGNVKDDDEQGTISIVDIQDDNKTQYLNQNFEQGNYNYGYDIKPSGPVGQFHHENKAPDNVVYGCYGYEAPNAQAQMTFYISDAWGYRPVRQEESTEVFYPADNPEGTTHMKGTSTPWKDLVFPDMCAHFAERIASSSNVVTNSPAQFGSTPPGLKFQTPLLPSAPVSETPTPTGFGSTSAPVPSGSFDVIHLNTPNGGVTPQQSTPNRFSVSDSRKPAATSFGSQTNLPPNGQNDKLNPSPPVSGILPLGPITSTAGNTGVITPSGQVPIRIPTSHRNTIPTQGGLSTTSAPPNESDVQSSNNGALFPNRPGGTPNQGPSGTNGPFTGNRLIGTGNLVSTTAFPGSAQVTQGPATSGNRRVPGGSLPSVTTNEVPTGGGGPASKTHPNQELPSTTIQQPQNPYGASADDEDSNVPIAPHGNRNPSVSSTTTVPASRFPQRGSSTTRTPSGSSGTRFPSPSRQPTGGSGNPVPPGSGQPGTDPALSIAEGSTTFLLPNRSPNPGDDQNLVSGSPNAFATQGTKRPSSFSGTVPQSTRQPLTSSPHATSSLPSTGFSGKFNNPSSLQPSSTNQQTVPNKFSQLPGGSSADAQPDQENGVSDEGSNIGLYSPTKQPTTPQLGGNRFPSPLGQSPPAIPQEPELETETLGSTQALFPAPGVSGTPARLTANPSKVSTTNQPSNTQPFSASPVINTTFGTRRPTPSPSTRSPPAPPSVSTRAPSIPASPSSTRFSRPIPSTLSNFTTGNERKPDDFCETECSSCKAKETLRDEDFAQIPGAFLSNIPVIFYPDCSPNAYARPAIVPFCPTQGATQCGDSAQQSLSMKFPDAASNLVVSHDAPVARNAFVANSNQQSAKGGRKVRRGRQSSRVLRS